MSSEFIIELWDSLRPLVGRNDRPQAADHIIRLADEYGLSDGIEAIPDLDRQLRKAVDNYFEVEEPDEDDERGGDW